MRNPVAVRIRFIRCFLRRMNRIPPVEKMDLRSDFMRYLSFRSLRACTMFGIPDLFNFSVKGLPFQFSED